MRLSISSNRGGVADARRNGLQDETGKAHGLTLKLDPGLIDRNVEN
jgi:hypothetical protein